MKFNEYPYLNLTDLNLDYILNAIREMKYEVTNFVSINAIKYADPIQWSIIRQYEKNTIVIDPVSGTAYISVAPVPSGVALTREEYWTIVFDLSSFVTKAAQNFTRRWESDTTLTATFATPAGAWLVWGNVLYKALTNITAGDQYVIDSNIEHFTIEDLYNAYLNTIAAILEKIGDLEDLNTSDKTSIVNAINSVVSDFNDKIGDINELDTDDKSNTVAAINENVSNIDALKETRAYVNVKKFGAIGDGQHDDTSAFQNAINSLTKGGIVFIPNGTYLISSPIYIGNGRENNGISSLHCIEFIGESRSATTGGNPWRTNYGVIIRANATMSEMLVIDGITHDNKIKNITLECRNMADVGIRVTNAPFSKIENIAIYDAKNIGLLFNSMSTYPTEASGTANNIQCQVENCVINNGFSDNAICLRLSGAPFADTCETLFRNLWLLYSGNGGAGLSLGFCDSNTFINIMEYMSEPSNNSFSIILDDSEFTGYPDANMFYSVSTSSDGYSIGANSGHNVIHGLMLGDGGLAPYSPHLIAYDNDGILYNDFTLNKQIPNIHLDVTENTKAVISKNATDDTNDYGTDIADYRNGGISTVLTVQNHHLLLNGSMVYDVDNPYLIGQDILLTLLNGVTGALYAQYSDRTNMLHIHGIITLPSSYTSGTNIAEVPDNGHFVARGFKPFIACSNNTGKTINDFLLSSRFIRCYNTEHLEEPIGIDCIIDCN